MIAGFYRCDRCSARVDKPCVLHSMQHKLRKSDPQWRLDLCERCMGMLVAWVERGALLKVQP